MREIGAFEAKNKLGQLLNLVEQGEEVIITRHGKEVARLVPVRPTQSREQAHAALRRIRERAQQRKLGRFDWWCRFGPPKAASKLRMEVLPG
jgi:prevent-host-death family protein